MELTAAADVSPWDHPDTPSSLSAGLRALSLEIKHL